MKEENFLRFTGEFLRIADLCQANGIKLEVILSPTLLGPEPGTAQTLQWLEKSNRFRVHDFVEAMPDPQYYYNLDHLNTAGVREFLTRWVKPVLQVDS